MRVAILAMGLLLAGCEPAVTISGKGTDQPSQKPASARASQPSKKKMEGETLVVGGGCFWCIEPLFEMVKGVKDVESGYAGGERAGVTYEEVCSGRTGHAEVIKVTYDAKAVSADDLLRLFFTIHDPTTKDRQGPDTGPQYRSAVFYSTPDEKARAERIIREINQEKIWKNPIVTTLEPLKNYTVAEDYHQDYYKKFETASETQKMRMNAGYCRVVIDPKVRAFREKFKHLLK